MKRVHNDSLAAICTYLRVFVYVFMYLYVFVCICMYLHVFVCIADLPTIFEAFNFFIKKLFTPLDLCVSSCWVAVFPPSSACIKLSDLF